VKRIKNNSLYLILIRLWVLIILGTCIGLCTGSCASNGIIIDAEARLYTCNSMGGRQLVKLPGWKNSWHVVDSCQVATSAEVSIAMKIFYMHWLENFGDPFGRVKNNLHQIMILWGDEYKIISGYSMDGRYVQNVKVQGLAYTKGTVWVKKTLNARICRTSLIHELVHASIWTLKETDGDPDHLGGKYVGWTIHHSALIETIKRELCHLEI